MFNGNDMRCFTANRPTYNFVFLISELTFSNGIDESTITVPILPDDIPEGPESFYVNLTNVRLATARLVVVLPNLIILKCDSSYKLQIAI